MLRPLHRAKPRHAGLTLVELMLVLVVMGVLVTLVAPSFNDMIVMQRLRGVSAQLNTDLHYARSEALSSKRIVRVSFRDDGNRSCYTVTQLDVQGFGAPCNCLLGAGSTCTGQPAMRELRTVEIPRTGKVRLVWSPPAGMVLDANQRDSLSFDPESGGLGKVLMGLVPQPLTSFRVDAVVDTSRTLRSEVVESGRVSTCAPDPARMGVRGCT